ncbi:MAG: TRM11 family SAM-dependent methyltransferase [Halobacteriota archaeon]
MKGELENRTRAPYSDRKKNPPRGKATLFPNVQFIYELVLAQLELHSLSVAFEMDDELSGVTLLNIGDDERLKRRLAYFQTVNGEYTDYFYISQKNRTRSVNQYLTHWIYPYKGKFHPQMIRAALNIIGLQPGETVLDPFIGSGTTALEAQLLGVNCVGLDASPLCVLQSRVKTASREVIKEIQAQCEALPAPSRREAALDEKALKFIASGTDQRVQDFFRLAKLVALSDSVRRKKDFASAFDTRTKLMVQSVTDYDQIRTELKLSLGRATIEQGDARALPLRDESIDGIITSPPYAIALDYIKNDAHALEALGLDLREMREQFVGLRGRINERVCLYNEDIKRSLDEMMRVLKPNKYALIVIGNAAYKGRTLESVELIVKHANEIGLRLTSSINKTIFGLYNVMQREKVLIFKKDGECT